MSEVHRTRTKLSGSKYGVLCCKLRDNLLGCDCLISLFWAASNSYRYDTLLRPYPPMYTLSEEKRIEDIRSMVKSFPSADKIADQKVTLMNDQVELLEWIITPKTFSLHYRPLSSIEHILTNSLKLPNARATLWPQYVFELVYGEEAETHFQSVVDSQGTFYAFHGSNVENFHSILHNGLLNMFNKVSAFGEGTYLSSELSVCLNWSPSGSLWPGSLLPRLSSLVAVCEVVKHPSVMSKEVQHGREPNLQNRVPEEYFIVSNDELVRVKYLLLYSRESATRSSSRSWLYNNMFIVILLVYAFIIFLVGSIQSNFVRKLYRQYISDF